MPPTRSERIRVLVLVKGLGLGGAEKLIAESAAFWDRQRFDYRVVYLLPWKDQLVARLSELGVAANCADWKGPFDFGGYIRLRRVLREESPRIVHSHLPGAGILARTLARDASHVYTEHNIVSSYRLPTRLLNRLTYGLNDGVIAVSEAVSGSLAGYPGPPRATIPNGVLLDPPSPAETRKVREDLEIGERDPLVVHVGNIRPHKGHENLLTAMAKVVETRPEVVLLSIGGEKNSGDLERVRDLARDLGIEKNVRILGRRFDARSFLAAADLVVNPSDAEGLPLVVLEALALGRPVVATAVGGVPSIVRHGETGLLVDPADPDALAQSILQALASPDAQGWGEAGSRLVEQDYGLRRMVEAYESMYERVVA